MNNNIKNPLLYICGSIVMMFPIVTSISMSVNNSEEINQEKADQITGQYPGSFLDINVTDEQVYNKYSLINWQDPWNDISGMNPGLLELPKLSKSNVINGVRDMDFANGYKAVFSSTRFKGNWLIRVIKKEVDSNRNWIFSLENNSEIEWAISSICTVVSVGAELKNYPVFVEHMEDALYLRALTLSSNDRSILARKLIDEGIFERQTVNNNILNLEGLWRRNLDSDIIDEGLDEHYFKDPILLRYLALRAPIDELMYWIKRNITPEINWKSITRQMNIIEWFKHSIIKLVDLHPLVPRFKGHVVLDNLPYSILMTQEFSEHDDVTFHSSWGVPSDDIGHSSWMGSIDYVNTIATYINYAHELDPTSIIIEPQVFLRGLDVRAISQIIDTPIGYADIDYNLNIHDIYSQKIFTDHRDDLEIPLPPGHNQGEQWGIGFVQGLTIALVAFGAVELFGVTAGLGGSVGADLASLFADATIPAALGGLSSAAFGASAGAIAAAISHANSLIGMSLEAAEMYLRTFSIEQLEKSLHDFQKELLEKIMHRLLGNQANDATQIWSDYIIDKFDDNALIELSNILRSMRNQQTYFNVMEEITDNNNIRIDSVLRGTAKSTSLFGDRSIMKMINLLVRADYVFEYNNYELVRL